MLARHPDLGIARSAGIAGRAAPLAAAVLMLALGATWCAAAEPTPSASAATDSAAKAAAVQPATPQASTAATQRATPTSKRTGTATAAKTTTVAKSPVAAKSSGATATPATDGGAKGAPTASSTPAAPAGGTKAADASAVKPGAAGTIRPATVTPTVTTTRPARPSRAASAARPSPAADVTPVEERVTYQYNALGRRDPFMPLVGGPYVGAEQQLAPPDIGGLKVVGIVWGAQDKFALCEDARGNSMVLRRGDKVMNGTVEGLRRDAIVVKISTDGQSDMVEIPLTRKGEGTNESR